MKCSARRALRHAQLLALLVLVLVLVLVYVLVYARRAGMAQRQVSQSHPSVPTYERSPVVPASEGQEVPQEEPSTTDIAHFTQLPTDYDARLTAVLRESVPADVILRFFSMAASKNPSSNYRWDLAQDGRLFVVHHSGRNPSAELPFDKPLPTAPSRTLGDEQITELFSKLDEADFFNQPALQRPAVSEGGTFNVVRARRDGTLHDVVYENISNPLIDYLDAIAW